MGWHMRKVVLGLSLVVLALLSPAAGLCADEGLGGADMAPNDLDAANAALLQAEAELLDSLDKPAIKPDVKPAPQKESPKASLRSEAKPEPVKQPAPAPVAKQPEAEKPVQTAAAAPIKKAEPAKPAKPAPAAAAKLDVQQFKNMTQEISGELENLHGENTALKSQVKFQGKTVQSLQAENNGLREQLRQSQNQLKALIARMTQMRNSLMVAETEVERLNAIVQDINHTSQRREHYRTEQAYGAPQERRRDVLLSPAQERKASEDMPIATVIVDKANLRAGAGMEHSPIMSIAKGTRLAIETKSGDWYRVVAPTGERAWISRDTVAYGKDAQSSPSRTIRVKSYDPSIEDEAMELVRKTAR